MEEVQRWRQALTQVANIAGWDIRNKSQSAQIGEIASENLEVIYIDCDLLLGTVRADGLSKIKHLKLLKLEDVKFSGNLNHLSNEIAYLNWKEYPFKCLPQSFQPEKLVELYLVRSSIERLWEGTKPLHNLKRLDLSYSEDLVEMPDVREALNLEKIELKGCIKLPKINPSIGLLKKLAFLNLGNCKNLVSLPNTILGLNSLEYMNVSGCSKLSQRNLVSYLLPSSPPLPSSLTCLRELDLSFCNLVQIPDAIGNIEHIGRVHAAGSGVDIPRFFGTSSHEYSAKESSQ
ncbi:hypothetical protein VNO80_02004 [Phaseolus coccineus]|uniref:Uncharacterized protein n=1 Tax=Phaseolus coccineus TaxID=3886 RepID=A0AAN9WY11_PHACN